MSNFRQLIKGIQKKLDQTIASTETQMHLLGEHLSRIDPLKIGKSPLKNLYLKSRDVINNCTKLQETIEKLKELVSLLADVDNELRGVRSEMSIAEKEIPTYLQQVGIASLKVYQNNHAQGKPYNDLFADAVRSEKGIRRIEKQIAGSQLNSRIWLKAIGAGKRICLGMFLKTNNLRQTRMLQSVGEKVCEGDFSDQMADEELSRVMEPVGEARREIQRLGASEEKLKEKKMILKQEIAQIGTTGDPRRAMKEMTARLKKGTEQLGKTLRNLGKTALTLDIELIENFEDQETIKIVKKVIVLQGEKKDYERQMKRLEAALKIDQIDERISATEAHIEHLKSVVERKTNQINSLNQLIAEMEGERNRYLRVRGSEETLIKKLPKQ